MKLRKILLLPNLKDLHLLKHNAYYFMGAFEPPFFWAFTKNKTDDTLFLVEKNK